MRIDLSSPSFRSKEWAVYEALQIATRRTSGLDLAQRLREFQKNNSPKIDLIRIMCPDFRPTFGNSGNLQFLELFHDDLPY
jgi:hypothetical protein